MKWPLILVFFSALESTVALAQDNVVTATAGSAKTPDLSQKGFYVGLDYMNLSDVHGKEFRTSENGTVEKYNESGTHMGLAGFTVGYTETPDTGLGYGVGTQWMDAINPSEYGDQKLQLIIPEANLKLAIHRRLVIFAGFNMSIWTGFAGSEHYAAQLGGQAGLGFRLGKRLTLSAGYTALGQNHHAVSNQDDVTTHYLVSGLNSNLTYTF